MFIELNCSCSRMDYSAVAVVMLPGWTELWRALVAWFGFGIVFILFF